MVLMNKTTQDLRHTNRSSRGSYLASTLIRDLQGQLQLELTPARHTSKAEVRVSSQGQRDM